MVCNDDSRMERIGSIVCILHLSFAGSLHAVPQAVPGTSAQQAAGQESSDARRTSQHKATGANSVIWSVRYRIHAILQLQCSNKCTALHRAGPYLTLLDRALPYWTVRYHTGLYLTILEPYPTGPCCTVLDPTLPCCTVLYITGPYTEPYRTIPYHIVPCRT